jgi:hypothetical protein
MTRTKFFFCKEHSKLQIFLATFLTADLVQSVDLDPATLSRTLPL